MEQEDQKVIERHKDELQSIRNKSDSKDKEKAERIREHIRDLLSRQEKLFVKTSKQLYKITRESRYMLLDNPETGEKYHTFKEFCNHELPYSKRRAHYMAQIWEYYAVDHSKEFLNSLRHLGWSKLKELIGVVTPDNKDEWLERAENASHRDLKSKIKEIESENDEEEEKKEPEEEKTNKEPKEPSKSKKTLELEKPQEDSFEEAKNVVSSVTGEESDDEEALEMICNDFLAENHDLSGEDNADRKFLQRIEEKLGVSLFAENNGSLEYGNAEKLVPLLVNELSEEEILSLLEEHLDTYLISVNEKQGVTYGIESIDRVEQSLSSSDDEIDQMEDELVS